MKKHIIFVLAMFTSAMCFGQTNIKITFSNTHPTDSVKIINTNTDYAGNPILATSYNSTIVLQQKTPLEPGLYAITCDNSTIGDFIISSSRNQVFSIFVSDNDLSFTGSLENEHYASFLRKMEELNGQLKALEQELTDAEGHLPQYMLKPIIDTLTAKAIRINAAKEVVKNKTIQENPNTLLASIIQCFLEMPQPDANITNNRMLIQEYYVQHYFDNFPWTHSTILKTAVGINKVREFCSIIAQLNRPDLDPYVLSALQSAKIDTATYFMFFDKLEKVLGDHASPYRIERLYIKMLKDMQTLPKLPAERKRHCAYELSVIDKNHEGDLAPNFNIVTDKGEKMSLYDIQSEYLLLYLQHPTCPTCQRVRKMIADFPVLNRAIANGKLTVLTVYFEDEQEIWDNYKNSEEANPNYMHGWNYDQSIEKNKLYDTRAIPYMFILDKDKRILRKNVMETQLEDVLRQLKISY